MLVGTWHIILWSRNLLITTIADLDILIDKLEASQPIKTEKTFYEWVKDPPDVQCPQLTILSAEDSTKFELAYRLGASGRAKSIIGKWDRGIDGEYLWRLAPTLSMQLCVSYGETPNPALVDTIVLTEIGSIPPCDNVIVLSKRFDPTHVSSVRDFLEERHVESAFNKLVKIHCTMNEINTNTITR
uniref:Uncharacterized protein n=1 Tax=Acrobeloides nanus TaxID=290746 RepID=A0A914DJS1_9BILA